MAVNCNITKFALDKIKELQWKTNCNSSNIGIIEDYISYLNCNVLLVNCSKVRDCKSYTDAVILNCNFKVPRLDLANNTDNSIVVSTNSENYAGGKPPYTYTWRYNTAHFNSTSPLNGTSILLIPVPEKKIAVLVSRIILTVIDSNGCISTKSCLLTPEGFKCNINYLECPNPRDLTVVDTYVVCPRPKNLVII